MARHVFRGQTTYSPRGWEFGGIVVALPGASYAGQEWKHIAAMGCGGTRTSLHFHKHFLNLARGKVNSVIAQSPLFCPVPATGIALADKTL